MNFTRHKITYHTPHDHTPQERYTNISDAQRAKRAQRDLNPRPSD